MHGENLKLTLILLSGNKVLSLCFEVYYFSLIQNILSSINLTTNRTLFCLNILKNCGNPISHQIYYWALSFPQGVYLRSTKCYCSKVVQENNGCSLILSLHDIILLIFTIETKRVYYEMRIYIDQERAIYFHPHSTLGRDFCIIRHVGYRHTFCENFVSTKNCFSLYFR